MRVLEDWLTSYMKFTENTEPPRQYNLWCGISCLAACLQRKVFIKKGFDEFFPNFYIILVGKSAVRKGTAMKPARLLLEEVGIPFAGDAVTREQLIREIFGSVSEYRLGNKIEVHSSLTIFSPELTVFLGYNNQQLMSNLVDWFDCAKVWENKTKNKGIEVIKKVWVNILAATTPDLIRATMPRELIGGGLASRMIFVYADKKHKSIPNPTYSEELMSDLINDLKQIKQTAGEIKKAPDFVKAYDEWYEQEDQKPTTSLKDIPEFDGYMGRRASHLMRLCIIMNASRKDSDLVLTEYDFQRALSILEEVESGMPYVFRGYGETDRSAVMNKVMVTIAKKGKISRNELLKLHIWDFPTKEALFEMVAVLEYAGYCKVVLGTEGQETMIYYNEQRG